MHIEQQNNASIWYEAGVIWRILADFEPIILEEAGFSKALLGGVLDTTDDDIFLQDNSTTFAPHSYKKLANKHPFVQNHAGYNDFSVVNIDWSFGLAEYLPGLADLVSPSGFPDLIKGFVKGSRVKHNEYFDTCEKVVVHDFIHNLYVADNITASISQQPDTVLAIFNVFDLLMTYTKLSTFLHPIAFNCWLGGEAIGDHFVYQIVVVNGTDEYKAYIMNIVYNFGHIFDSLRDFVFFLLRDTRGDVTSVYDAGYSLGQFIWFSITKDIAQYES